MAAKTTAVFLVALGLLSGAPASAQVFTEAAFDSINKSTSVAELVGMRTPGLRAGADVPAMLRSGFASLRLWQVRAERDDADGAKKLFERVLEYDPISAWGHFGKGLVLARGPGVRIPSPKGILDDVVTGQVFAEIFGVDPRSRAHNQIRKAIDVDPTLLPAVLELASLALMKRDNEQLHEARNILVATAKRVSDRRLWITLADVESALGLASAAENAAERLLQDNPTDALGLHARARALFLQKGKARAAAEAYFAGLDQRDSTASDKYFEDLAYILSDDELLRYRALSPEDRVSFIRKFWELRAARAGVTVEERLAEHYTRLGEAWSKYGRKADVGAPGVGALLAEELRGGPFDDRGVILVRHGKPVDVISTITNGFPPNETWVYRQPDTVGFRLFNFFKQPGDPDYRLLAQLPPCDSSKHSELDQQVRLGLLTPYDPRWVEGVIKYYEDRGKYDQRLHRIATGCHAATLGRTLGRGAIVDTASLNLETQQLGLEMQRVALQALGTDSHRPDFDVPFSFIHRLYAFRGKESASDLTAALLIPGNAVLPARTSSGNTVYPVSVSLILMDTSTQHVVRLDSTLYFESRRVLMRDDFLRLHVTLSASLGERMRYRLVVRDAANPTRGGAVAGMVPGQQLTSRRLRLSDIVIAESDSGRWERGQVGLALMPPHEIDDEKPFVLFYEIYNVPAGTAYLAEVAFEKAGSGIGGAIRGLFGGNSNGLRLRFSGETTADDISQISHRIGSELDPGEYRLRITVTDNSTLQKDTRETKLVILPKNLSRNSTEPIKR